MNIPAAVLALTLSAALAACAPFVPSSRQMTAPMFVVTNLEPAQLMGTWYEVASFPARFQAGCGVTTATYSLRDDGLIGVQNRCEVEGQPGVARQIAGTASIDGPGRLKVRLDGVPFPARFWVLDISRDGNTMIVGTPSRVSGWVLKRSPGIGNEALRRAADVFEKNGYDIAGLQRSATR